MPQYFFHIRDGENLIRDDEGLSLSDLSAAKAEGLMSAADIARQPTYVSDGSSIEVSDQAGTILDRIFIKPYHLGLAHRN